VTAQPSLNTESLVCARRVDSRTKRDRALRTVDKLTRAGARITFAPVAREAGV